jgi:hypothetical protein
MASTQPGRGTGHVASATPALQRQPRRRRRWGRLMVAGLTVVLIAALVPRALADDGDDMSFDFQFESPAELADDQLSLDAAADPDGGDQTSGGGEVTAGPAPIQDEGGGVSGTPDPGVGGDDPKRADAPGVAQADTELSVSTWAQGLEAEQETKTEQETETDLGSRGVVVGLDPKLTPDENIGEAIQGILEAEAMIEAAVFEAKVFASYAREVARMEGDYAAIRDAGKQADVAATVAEEEVAAARIMADNIAFQAGKLEEVGDHPGAARARYAAEVAKATVKDLAAKAESARVAAYDANTADVDTGGD